METQGLTQGSEEHQSGVKRLKISPRGQSCPARSQEVSFQESGGLLFGYKENLYPEARSGPSSSEPSKPGMLGNTVREASKKRTGNAFSNDC